MAAQIMDGSAVAAATLQRVGTEVSDFVAEFGRRPVLATVLVGDDPASHTYARMKANRCRSVGMDSLRIEIPADAATEAVFARIKGLSENPQIDGILLQHRWYSRYGTTACRNPTRRLQAVMIRFERRVEG